MRVRLLLLALVAATSVAMGQTNVRPVRFIPVAQVSAARQCTRESLTLKEGETNAAMGGVRLTDYILTNRSSSACTLNGYPRLELLNSSGRVVRRAANSDQLAGDGEKTPAQLVTLEPGKTAWFAIYYNSGGAGHMGKPCPTYPKVRIFAPGTEGIFLLRSAVQSCPGTDFNVSAVRSGTPQ